MLLSCTPVTSFAATEENTVITTSGSAESYPFILIRGVDFGALYSNYGTPEQEKAVDSITAGGVASALLKAIGSGIIHFSTESAVEEIIKYAGNVLGKLGCNKDGTPVYDLGLDRFPLNVSNYEAKLIKGGGRGAEEGIVKSSSERYGANNVYYFTYDWRLNPLDLCDEINDMVNLALSEHITSKVNIVCASMGGIEGVAYLTKYGYDKVNKLVFISSTLCGTYIVSDLFCGRLSVAEPALFNFLDDKTDGNKFMNFVVNTLYKTGVLKLVSGFANKFIDKYKDKVYNEFLTDTFGTMPIWWGLLQPEDYDEAINYMFGGREDEYAGIIAISKELQTMLAGRDRLLKDAAANGVKISIVANYNSATMPIFERAYANSDGGLETALVSGGATVADYGKTLDDSYVSSNTAFVSPDNVIDASTCLFPDSTWLVKDGEHVACSYGTEYSDFLFWLIDFAGRPTVYSNTRYPQFMISGSGQTLASLS